jgi:hypothetical protein
LSVVVVMWNFWVVMWIKDSLVATHHTGKEQLIPQCVLDQWVCTFLCHFCCFACWSETVVCCWG